MLKSNSIPIDKVRAYNYAKQHVVPTAKAQDIKQVAKNLIGLHSARLRTPYITLYTRINDFSPSDLRHELYYSRSMIKLRCMRKTLHIVDFEIAPIVHQATLKFRLSEFKKLHESLIAPDCHLNLREQIISLIANIPLSSDEIVNSVNLKKKYNSTKRNKIIKIVLKEMWEEGTLCYINESQHWEAEKRRYGYTAYIYPNLALSSIGENEAQERLIEYHIEKFGPVTEGDISWWTGLGTKRIRDHITKLNKKLIHLTISGFDNVFYMFVTDFEALVDLKKDTEPWVSFLAYEDPTLKGYHESRYRYIDLANYNKLFNDIGEARPSIVVNGQVIGIWEWNKKTEKISWFTFKKVKPSFLQKIKTIAQTFEHFHKFAN